uniref:Uncharacterized protein n=1 Tax=Anopheles maculatus TaxID=74869 RepID=A0A182T0H1_9DIPT
MHHIHKHQKETKPQRTVTGTGLVFGGISGAGAARAQLQGRSANGGGGRRKRRCCQNGGDGDWKNVPDQCIELIIMETSEELAVATEDLQMKELAGGAGAEDGPSDLRG